MKLYKYIFVVSVTLMIGFLTISSTAVGNVHVGEGLQVPQVEFSIPVGQDLRFEHLTSLTFPMVVPIYSQGDTQPSLPASTNQDIRFTHITSDDGLSHNGVFAIVQDQAGFLWIGTVDGLNRYDGYDFTVYKPDYEDPNSIGDRYVRALLVDQFGNIWIATRLGGLNKFDPLDQTFSHYKHNPDDPESLTSGPVFSLYEDRSGIIWVGTEQGLNSIDPTSGEITHYLHNPDGPNSISNNTVWAMYEDDKGVLWFGTQGGGLNALDRKSGEFTHYRHDPDNTDSLCDDRVWTIMEDSFGVFWLGTQGGLYALDPETGSGTCHRHDPGNPNSLGNDLVKAIYGDSQGVLWVGTWGGGVNIFDRVSGEFIRYQHDPSKPASLANDKIATIFEDEGSILWVGTWGGGLNKFDRSQQRFIRIQHDPENPNSINSNIVHSVFESNDGAIWIGTNDALNKYDRSKGKFTSHQYDPNDLTTINVGEAVQSIFEDSQGILWVGSWAEGLNRYDPDIEVFQHYRNDPQDVHSISSDVVLSLYEDSIGVLWIGTLQGGLNKFDRQTERFQAYRHNPQDPYSISEDHIYVIYEDQSGLLWLGTGAGGLNWFDREREEFGVIRYDPDNSESLSADKINAIYQDSSGAMWVGTPNGLNKIIFTGNDISQDISIKRYTEKNGLPSDFIQAILEDDQGYLWLSSTRGISRFNPQTGSFTNFTAAHGLSGNEFNESAAVRLSSGEILFGGGAGLTSFTPDQITDNSYLPPIRITDFKILNKPVGLGGDSPLQHSVWETDQLSLSHQDDVLTFEFAALSFANPNGNQYQYMLEGFDHEWSPVSDQRFATYTNLDPGEYVFRVLGSNNDGVWNEEGASIAITITPPWWGTTWFRGVLILLAVAGLFGAYQWRVSSLESRSRQLETQVAERTKELATLLAVSQEVTSTLELEPLLNLILDELQKVVDYDVATIRRLVHGNMELQAHRWLSPQEGQPSSHLPVEDIPIIREMVQTRQAILVGDHQFNPEIVGEEERFSNGLTGEVLQASRTLISVPLVLKDEVIGMLVLGHHQPDYWSDETKELVQAFANQAAVAIANAELYEQAGEAATLEERTRLARDLHDSATQSLYSATLFNEAGKELAEKGDLESARYYQSRVGEVVYQALKDMRLLVFQLRRPVLEKEGFLIALQHRLDAVEKRAGMDARLVSDQLPRLPHQVSEELYSITIEALNNTLKHAQADKVTITILSDGGEMDLEVHDDGQGFDPQAAYRGGGMGITNMTERAAKLGADLTIDSSPDQGTSVRVIFLLPESPSKSDRLTENEQ